MTSALSHMLDMQSIKKKIPFFWLKKILTHFHFSGKQKTRQTLNAKISQLNSAIDNVSSRLRGGNNDAPTVPIKIDPEVEATM